MNKIHLLKSIFILLTFTIFQPMLAQSKIDSTNYINEALEMINSPAPQFDGPFVHQPTPKEIADLGFEQPNKSEPMQFQMRDGIKIYANKFHRSTNVTVILLHGVLASSFTYNKMAGLLRDALDAEVIAVDLRGHGQSGGLPGDISTFNQYAEDLDDLVSSIKSDKPSQKIILAGHSMGGGVVLRYVETFPQNKINGYLLFAPNLGSTAPTSKQSLDLQNNFIKMHLVRGLGLEILNEYGIHKFDSLRVVYFNVPEQMPLKSYSHRSMKASVPIDYKNTLRKINKPLLVLVGSKDEAFVAEEYPAVIKAYSNGECVILKDETHNGIRHNKDALDKIRNWGDKNNLR